MSDAGAIASTVFACDRSTSVALDQLEYVHGGEAGLSRERRRGESVILDSLGEPVTDADTLARVRELRIPPAWTHVWIAASPNAHLQATGLDSKGRRQYLYHPLWRERRDHEKYDDMLEFAGKLPRIRATTSSLLGARHAERDRTLALAVRLLDIGLFRVGWDRYARDNGHVGLTTLRRENVTLRGQEVHFDFVAKSGKRRRMTVRDPQSVAALAGLKHRRGAPDELLVFRSDHRWRRIHASDVNNALRTWGGAVLGQGVPHLVGDGARRRRSGPRAPDRQSRPEGGQPGSATGELSAWQYPGSRPRQLYRPTRDHAVPERPGDRSSCGAAAASLHAGGRTARWGHRLGAAD